MRFGFAMWLWDARLPQFVPKRYAIPLSVSPLTTTYVRSPLEQTVCDWACALPTFRPRVIHTKSTPSNAATLNFLTKLTALYCWKYFQTCWCIRKITFPLDYDLRHSQSVVLMLQYLQLYEYEHCQCKQRPRLHSISHTKWVILTQFGI